MRRKAIPPFEEKRFCPVVLYRGDLDEIIAALEEGDLKVTIQSGEYVYESFEEVAEHIGKKVKDLRIAGDEEGGADHVYVTAAPFGAKVTATTDLKIAGVAARVGSILSSKQRRHVAFTEGLTTLLGVGSLLALVVALILAVEGPRSLLIWPLLASAVGFAVHFAMYPLNRSDINIIRRHEETTFWDRKGDDVRLALVSAALGAALALLVQWLF